MNTAKVMCTNQQMGEISAKNERTPSINNWAINIRTKPAQDTQGTLVDAG